MSFKRNPHRRKPLSPINRVLLNSNKVPSTPGKTYNVLDPLTNKLNNELQAALDKLFTSRQPNININKSKLKYSKKILLLSVKLFGPLTFVNIAEKERFYIRTTYANLSFTFLKITGYAEGKYQIRGPIAHLILSDEPSGIKETYQQLKKLYWYNIWLAIKYKLNLHQRQSMMRLSEAAPYQRSFQGLSPSPQSIIDINTVAKVVKNVDRDEITKIMLVSYFGPWEDLQNLVNSPYEWLEQMVNPNN